MAIWIFSHFLINQDQWHFGFFAIFQALILLCFWCRS
jgi:hypothetical protein